MTDEERGFKLPEGYTPGPWNWDIRSKFKQCTLENYRTNVVMDFRRWGMNGAQPLFINDGFLYGVEDFCEPIPGREHHEWEKRINHPDAELIALAPQMADHIRRLEGELIAIKGLMFDHAEPCLSSFAAGTMTALGYSEMETYASWIASEIHRHVDPAEDRANKQEEPG